MKFAIRDDDTSFFTTPEELEKAYSFINSGCVSLSVVPYTVPIHKDDVFPYGKNIEYGQYSIGDNSRIVEYLKKGYKKGKYDILLHGFSHEYKKVEGKWLAEMLWKPEEQLLSEISKGKAYLEALFDCPIKVFVAPNNMIGTKGMHAIIKNQMNFSGIIYSGDRDISVAYIINYLKRWSERVIKGIPYAGVLDYKDHLQLVPYSLDSFERLKKEYHVCKQKNVPFVVYSHYWYLNRSPETKALLKRIYEYVINDGAELVGVSDCF